MVLSEGLIEVKSQEQLLCAPDTGPPSRLSFAWDFLAME
jgi:hypothetical protein